MVERRPLTEGLKPTPPAGVGKEKEFVFGPKVNGGLSTAARVPLSTRIRADLASALKRASLERQLSGVEPNTIIDILEEAVEPWLKTNGFLR